MKARRIAIRPLRKALAALPAEIGNETVLLLRVDNTGRVVERQLFDNHKVGGRTCVHGFTHWARLPFYLPSPNAGGVPRPESALMPKHSTPEKL